MNATTFTATWTDRNGNTQTRTGLDEATARSLTETARTWADAGQATNFTLRAER